MGIPLLREFLKGRKGALIKPVSEAVGGKTVIIDGSNFSHALASSAWVEPEDQLRLRNHRFGGSYITYRRVIHHFIDFLRSDQVNAKRIVVVLDGTLPFPSQELGEEAGRGEEERNKERPSALAEKNLKFASSFNQFWHGRAESCYKVLQLLKANTLRAFHSKNVEVIQSLSEPDSLIVSLAKEESRNGCPGAVIISNYYEFATIDGLDLLPLSGFNIKANKCCIFNLAQIIYCLGISRALAAIDVEWKEPGTDAKGLEALDQNPLVVSEISQEDYLPPQKQSKDNKNAEGLPRISLEEAYDILSIIDREDYSEKLKESLKEALGGKLLTLNDVATILEQNPEFLNKIKAAAKLNGLKRPFIHESTIDQLYSQPNVLSLLNRLDEDSDRAKLWFSQGWLQDEMSLLESQPEIHLHYLMADFAEAKSDEPIQSSVPSARVLGASPSSSGIAAAPSSQFIIEFPRIFEKTEAFRRLFYRLIFGPTYKVIEEVFIPQEIKFQKIEISSSNEKTPLPAPVGGWPEGGLKAVRSLTEEKKKELLLEILKLACSSDSPTLTSKVHSLKFDQQVVANTLKLILGFGVSPTSTFAKRIQTDANISGTIFGSELFTVVAAKNDPITRFFACAYEASLFLILKLASLIGLPLFPNGIPFDSCEFGLLSSPKHLHSKPNGGSYSGKRHPPSGPSGYGTNTQRYNKVESSPASNSLPSFSSGSHSHSQPGGGSGGQRGGKRESQKKGGFSSYSKSKN